MSWAIDSIGDNFAVHGFASDGRHDVQYFRFKDFDQPYDDEAKSRMAGMKGGLSTRMGAALRHAGWHLTQQNAQKRLVLLITDGEPADIDERDPQYLRHDAKKAVEDLAMQGIYTYCLTLDPDADRYVARIFGENNYSIVDHVETAAGATAECVRCAYGVGSSAKRLSAGNSITPPALAGLSTPCACPPDKGASSTESGLFCIGPGMPGTTAEAFNRVQALDSRGQPGKGSTFFARGSQPVS